MKLSIDNIVECYEKITGYNTYSGDSNKGELETFKKIVIANQGIRISNAYFPLGEEIVAYRIYNNFTKTYLTSTVWDMVKEIPYTLDIGKAIILSDTIDAKRVCYFLNTIEGCKSWEIKSIK